MSKKRFNQIENIAVNVLIETKQYKVPVDVHKVAEFKKAILIPHEFGNDISGVLIIKNGQASIAFNQDNSPVRTRFTISHELGHLVLGHDNGIKVDSILSKNNFAFALYRNSKSSTGEDKQEREANAFAAALLMPRELLEKELDNITFDLSDDKTDIIKELARKFGVSSQAMAFRLANLGFLMENDFC